MYCVANTLKHTKPLLLLLLTYYCVFQHNSRKPVATEDSRRQHLNSYHRQYDQSRNSPHDHISQQLHQFVPAGKEGKIKEHVQFLFVSPASNSSALFAVNTRGRAFVGTKGHREGRCYLSWKRKTYVDPTQAITQISQRMWHDQGPSSLSISLRTHSGSGLLHLSPNCISFYRPQTLTRESRRQR